MWALELLLGWRVQLFAHLWRPSGSWLSRPFLCARLLSPRWDKVYECPPTARQPKPEAEELYLKGRYFWNKRTAGDLNKFSTFLPRPSFATPAMLKPTSALPIATT